MYQGKLSQVGTEMSDKLPVKDAFQESTEKYITSSHLIVDLAMENFIGASLNQTITGTLKNSPIKKYQD
ncbi:hypothetical protein D623_10024420 [Myotis brandtii]|uniref:Uncharacterized protein n=1 Tax=Myotis brandtii TaxID=109478 RepID=S7PVW5_MYOBR|nr:hypothetical protein D623_10024420 [Myotis brandtii]